MGTTQSVLARLENAHHMPRFDLVTRYATALGRRVRLDLVLRSNGPVLALRTGASKSWGRLWRIGSLYSMSDVATPVVYQLKVSLSGISPMIWRRLLVPAEMTLYTV